MRILFVIDGLALGGAEKQLLVLAKQLHKNGHNVLIYVLKKEGPRLKEYENSGLELVFDEKGYGINIPMMFRLRNKIKYWKPDIVHGYLFHGNLNSRLACVGLGVPVINSERNDNYKLSAGQALVHNLTKQLTTAVIANSYAGKYFAEKMFGLSDSRVHVVWNGLDCEYIDQLINESDIDYRTEFFKGSEIRIAVLVGSINPQKDHLLAIEVAKELISRDDRWRVLFIGDTRTYTKDNYKDQVMDKYEHSGLTDKIIFTGNRNDVLEIVSQMDVLFMTSSHEGFPNAVLEAMGVGTPVVSTEFSDIQKILPFDWQVIQGRSAKELAGMILYAYQHRLTTIVAQREWVELHATNQCLAENTLKIYNVY